MITALLRIRNEALIIADTLDHISKFTDNIYIYDDASTDNTVAICKAHPSRPHIIAGKRWEMRPVKGVAIADGAHKQLLLERARKKANPEWFVYMDADERFDVDFRYLLKADVDALVFELYDFYITSMDQDRRYRGGPLTELRNYCGPEFRQTLMVFRNIPGIFFPCNPLLRCREPWGFKATRVLFTEEKIRHYGKAISEKQWEDKVNYYSGVRGLSEKWKKRRGRAVHVLSDFGRPLLTWEELKQSPAKKGPCLYRYNSHLHRRD